MILRLLPLVLAASSLVACALPPPGAGDPSPLDVASAVLPVLARPQPCRGHVALTFDDGPTAQSRRIMNVLRFYRLPAVFFNTGAATRALPSVVAEESVLPSVQLGNHSYDHPDLTRQTPDALASELRRTAALQGARTELFRPPYGATNAQVRGAASTLGLLEVLWTEDSRDFAARSVAQVVEQSKGMQDGGILLLHDGRPTTVRALPWIVQHYYSQGLCFGRVARSDQLQAPAESPALTFYARAVAP